MNIKQINEALEEATGSEGTLAENLKNLIDGVAAAYDSVETQGGALPTNKNTENLPTAIEGI